MKVGERVKLTSIPSSVHDNELETQTLFEKWLGKGFLVTEIGPVEGLAFPLTRLEADDVVGEGPDARIIWVEPEYLELPPNE